MRLRLQSLGVASTRGIPGRVPRSRIDAPDPYWGYGSGGDARSPINSLKGSAAAAEDQTEQGSIFVDGYFVGTVDEFDGRHEDKLEQAITASRSGSWDTAAGVDIDIQRGNDGLRGQLRPRQ
jgi:hypothetical protein